MEIKLLIFFNETNAKKIKDKTKTGFDLIICRNVIPHINNLPHSL